ncbi:MAG: ROK family protein, partial [Chloroflexi bacterium]|nr:ROK family protein [Chloroflexota bacterium]
MTVTARNGAAQTEDGLDELVAVLDEIRLGRSGSRSELAARTGLGRAVVAQRVGDLIERGLVLECGPGRSTGGRPARQLMFNSTAGHVLVADLGATSIDVAVTSLDGSIIARRDEPSDITDGPAHCLGRVEALFEELRSLPDLPGRLWGV